MMRPPGSSPSRDLIAGAAMTLRPRLHGLALIRLVLMTLGLPVAAQGPTDSTPWHRRLQPFPAIASSPETGMQFGVTMLAVFDPPSARHARPASIVPTVVRSRKGQTRVSVDGEYWSADNDRRLQASVAWQRFPLPYYGLGDTTSESAKEIYTPQGIEAGMSVQQRLRGSWYGVATARVLDQTITPDSQSGVLRFNRVPGARGGRVVEGGFGVMRDSRDFVFNPTRGSLAQVSASLARPSIGSAFHYTRLRTEWRKYHALPRDFVLAWQIVGVVTSGPSVPFDQLAVVGGGDIMRGYTRGRFRDSRLDAAQLELRTPIRHRLGAIAFGGLGALSRDEHNRDRRLLPTYGAGLRVQIDPRQRTAVRVDYGRGRDGASGLYIGFNQAF